jgi:hypothetical protein
MLKELILCRYAARKQVRSASAPLLFIGYQPLRVTRFSIFLSPYLLQSVGPKETFCVLVVIREQNTSCDVRSQTSSQSTLRCFLWTLNKDPLQKHESSDMTKMMNYAGRDAERRLPWHRNRQDRYRCRRDADGREESVLVGGVPDVHGARGGHVLGFGLRLKFIFSSGRAGSAREPPPPPPPKPELESSDFTRLNASIALATPLVSKVAGSSQPDMANNSGATAHMSRSTSLL